jgi:hypothetical protein
MKKTAVAIALLMSSCVVPNPGVEETVDQGLEAQIDLALLETLRAQQAYRATAGSFAPDLATLQSGTGVSLPPVVTITITAPAPDAFCAQATHSQMDGTWHISSAVPSIAEGPCS